MSYDEQKIEELFPVLDKMDIPTLGNVLTIAASLMATKSDGEFPTPISVFTDAARYAPDWAHDEERIKKGIEKLRKESASDST